MNTPIGDSEIVKLSLGMINMVFDIPENSTVQEGTWFCA